jgi:hypothetical protein
VWQERFHRPGLHTLIPFAGGCRKVCWRRRESSAGAPKRRGSYHRFAARRRSNLSLNDDAATTQRNCRRGVVSRPRLIVVTTCKWKLSVHGAGTEAPPTLSRRARKVIFQEPYLSGVVRLTVACSQCCSAPLHNQTSVRAADERRPRAPILKAKRAQRIITIRPCCHF